jgi:hypothetical protein
VANLVITLEIFDVENAARAGKPFEFKYAIGATTPEQWDTAIKLLCSAQRIFEKNRPIEDGDEDEEVWSG